MKQLSIIMLCSLSLFLCASDESTYYVSVHGGMRAQSTQEENHFSYGACPTVTTLLDKNFYQKVVETLPILCIDICLVDLSTNRYLVMARTNRPAQGAFWFPGGRMFKGESFFEVAQRKCLEEIGVTVKIEKLIGIYNAIYPDSQWNTPTHTPIVAVLATCNQAAFISLDEQHVDYRWASLFEPDPIDYIDVVRKKALKILDLD